MSTEMPPEPPAPPPSEGDDPWSDEAELQQIPLEPIESEVAEGQFDEEDFDDDFDDDFEVEEDDGYNAILDPDGQTSLVDESDEGDDLGDDDAEIEGGFDAD